MVFLSSRNDPGRRVKPRDELEISGYPPGSDAGRM